MGQMTTVSKRREQAVFVKQEVSAGTLIVPAASDALFVLDNVTHPIAPEFIEDAQIRDTMSKTSPIKGRQLPGTWSLECYVKPSGTATTAPQDDVLLECAFGAAGAAVSADRFRYALGETFAPFSLWRKSDHTVYQLSCCLVKEVSWKFSGSELVTVSYSGPYARRYWAGYGTAASAVASSATSVTVQSGEGELFSVGAYIQLGADTNTAAGYKITAIASDVITFTPAAATGCSSSDVIRGYYPATSTELGAPIHGKLGDATLDGTSFKFIDGTVTMDNGIAFDSDEKTNSLYSYNFHASEMRTIKLDGNAYAYKGNVVLHDNLENQTDMNFIIPCGSTVPNIFTMFLPQFELSDDPNPTDNPLLKIPVKGDAYASASLDDEFKIVFGKASDS